MFAEALLDLNTRLLDALTTGEKRPDAVPIGVAAWFLAARFRSAMIPKRHDAAAVSTSR